MTTSIEPIDIRRDLTLELEKSKMSVDEVSPPSNKHTVNMSSTSNTPNYTQTSGSTSQSVTPSEFGYHNLNRPSNVVSMENSPKSEVYETIEQAFANYEQVSTPIQSLPPMKAKSPIKATINITYKSPLRNAPPPPPPTSQPQSQPSYIFTGERPISPDPTLFPDYEPVDVITLATKPLETSFEDNGVYEQLKFFKGAVSEVNHLLNNGNGAQQQQQQLQQQKCGNSKFNVDLNTPQVVPSIESATNTANNAANTEISNELITDDKSDSGDVLMPDQELVPDSLEFEANLSMYENVNLRKTPNAYENVNMRTDDKVKTINIPDTKPTLTLGSMGKENNKPANFTVKQLANKFETSPIDAQPPFDFSKPFARKNCDTNRNAVNPPKVKNPQQQLNKSNSFTRSLDENAFVREFGSSRSNEKVNRSTHQIPIVTNILTENSPIRRSFNDASKSKILNPPKLLPSLNDTDNNKVCKKENVDESTIDLKITPTTENPISLIQHNVNVDQKMSSTDDERFSSNNVSNKVLSNFKLDRERIERIKEERRHQLNEKFRSESFKCEKENNKVKSKSKIELNEMKDADKKISDSLQYKSKSRNEIYNKKDADASLALQPLTGANDGLSGRVRSVSDEKNQNDCADTTNIDEQSVAFRTRKFDRRSIDLKREQEFSTALNGTVRLSAAQLQ